MIAENAYVICSVCMERIGHKTVIFCDIHGGNRTERSIVIIYVDIRQAQYSDVYGKSESEQK